MPTRPTTPRPRCDGPGRVDRSIVVPDGAVEGGRRRRRRRHVAPGCAGSLGRAGGPTGPGARITRGLVIGPAAGDLLVGGAERRRHRLRAVEARGRIAAQRLQDRVVEPTGNAARQAWRVAQQRRPRVPRSSPPGLSPGYGSRPVSASYRTTPRLNRSLAGVSASPRSCSGDMNCSEPMLVSASCTVVRRARDAEVDELRRPGPEHDVARLHVAVDEPAVVDDPQAREQLVPDAEDLVARQEPAALVELVAQRSVAVEQLHDDEVRRTVAAGVVDVDQARMRQRRRRARLGQEALGERRVVGKRRREDLHGDVALEPDRRGRG